MWRRKRLVSGTRHIVRAGRSALGARVNGPTRVGRSLHHAEPLPGGTTPPATTLKNPPVELWKWDAVDPARAIRDRQLSSRAVVQASLQRMAQVGGAVIVGRTNAPALWMRWDTDNALHGRTLNP